MDGDQGFDITFGAQQFDPLDEDQDLPDEDDEPGLLAWFVQFREPLRAEDVARLRLRHGVRLTDFVPNLAYIERLPISAVKDLRTDPAVRAVVRYTPEMKIASTIPRDRADDNAPTEVLLNAVLFDDGDPSRVAPHLVSLGARNVTVLDSRAAGGWVTLRFLLPLARLDVASGIDGIRWLEPVPEIVDDDRAGISTSHAGTAGMLSVIWAAGLHGEGQIIGIIDNGPPDTDHCFFLDTADNTPRPDHRKVVALRNAVSQESGDHATFVAGCAAGDQVDASGAIPARGGAWAAKLVLGNRKDMTVFADPTTSATATATMLGELGAAARAGATIHSNSWHAKPQGSRRPAIYDLISAEVDTFTWLKEDHLVLGAAGNSPEEQGPPGTAKNAICVAAASGNASDARMGDGAPGPTADGRRKPDLMTVGCGIHSSINRTPCFVGPKNDCACSYATPFAAAAAALVRQYFVEGWYPEGVRVADSGFTPSGALLKSVLLNSTIATSGVAGYPTDTAGWGLVQLQRSLRFEGGSRRLRVWDVRNARGLQHGETRTYVIEVEDSAEPLKVTLVWTEPPGTPGTMTNPVVNNLDLAVMSPSGTRLLGNAFADGSSTPGGSPDVRNTVEMVQILAPALGDWTLTVRATAMNVGNPGQGFALVVSGAFR